MKFKKLLLLLSSTMPNSIRIRILRFCGARIGSNAKIGRGFLVDRAPAMTLGDNCHFNMGVHFYCGRSEGNAEIIIGNEVSIGPEAILCCASHEVGKKDRRAAKNTYGSIKVCDGCWIGMRSVIFPGVTIGEGCIIAAGAVVTKSTESHGLYAGVPARRVKDLPI